MDRTTNSAVRAYVGSEPGPIQGASADEVLNKIQKASNAPGTLADLKAVLFAYGYMPSKVGPHWFVNFPWGGPTQ